MKNTVPYEQISWNFKSWGYFSKTDTPTDEFKEPKRYWLCDLVKHCFWDQNFGCFSAKDS